MFFYLIAFEFELKLGANLNEPLVTYDTIIGVGGHSHGVSWLTVLWQFNLQPGGKIEAL